MTYFDIVSAVKERFPNSDAKEICEVVKGLEQRIIDEIFSPHGIEASHKNSTEEIIHSPTLLSKENILIYVYYVFSIFSLKEMDVDSANAYSAAFNENFSELAILYRRKYTPVKNTGFSGGI